MTPERTMTLVVTKNLALDGTSAIKERKSARSRPSQPAGHSFGPRTKWPFIRSNWPGTKALRLSALREIDIEPSGGRQMKISSKIYHSRKNKPEDIRKAPNVEHLKHAIFVLLRDAKVMDRNFAWALI
jgi:capsular polysaccharide biosynthesis protein